MPQQYPRVDLLVMEGIAFPFLVYLFISNVSVIKNIIVLLFISYACVINKLTRLKMSSLKQNIQSDMQCTGGKCIMVHDMRVSHNY